MTNDQLLDFIAEHRPQVVMYDVPWPYDERLADFYYLRGDSTRRPQNGWMAFSTSLQVCERLSAANVSTLREPFDFDEVFDNLAGCSGAAHWSEIGFYLSAQSRTFRDIGASAVARGIPRGGAGSTGLPSEKTVKCALV